MSSSKLKLVQKKKTATVDNPWVGSNLMCPIHNSVYGRKNNNRYSYRADMAFMLIIVSFLRDIRKFKELKSTYCFLLRV